MEKVIQLSTVEEIKAISDPYRIKILTVFRKLNRPLTVKEIADDMNEVPANVHYHVKKLEGVGILKLVYKKEINGIIAKYYEPTAEKYEIKSKTVDPVVESLVFDETSKAVVLIYDESKKKVLESLKNQEKEDVAAIRTSTLYLTDEEVQYFQNFIDDFMDKSKDDEVRYKNKKPYHFFNVLFTEKP